MLRALRSLAATVELSHNPDRFFDRRAAAHGADFTTSVWPLGEVAVVSRPNRIADLFAAGADALCAGEATRRVPPLLAGSILCADGEDHERPARSCLPSARPASQPARSASSGWPRARSTACRGAGGCRSYHRFAG